MGLDLSISISLELNDGRELFAVGDDALIACFTHDVSNSVVEFMAKRHPLLAVFRDSGFADDAARINAGQIFRELSPQTELRAI